ncbi:MAG: ThiF family adenylyltransferase, partial [Mycoplasma sp.]
MKVLILGSEGTPYSNGAFEFDVFFDSQYPTTPPKVNLITTGKGTVRFNPNLYANGKVCLSLLGTWRGLSSENWDAKISTLLQVLISIQSIIMSDLVYFNEPSCEGEMGKPEGEAKNEAYSNIVRYCNIQFAMIEQIHKPSKGFEDVIKRHFYWKKDQIWKEVRGWIERSKTAVAKYVSFSSEHNLTWSNKFNQPKKYTKMMEDIYGELEKVLNAWPLPSELKQKTNDEKVAMEKKNEKMTFEDIDKVDMSYDISSSKKEINLDDDAVKDRWSRYIGAMGIEAVQRQANSNIFLTGAGGLGIEIAKNIVLSGCRKFVLHDTANTTYYDLSSQFFLGESDLSKNRAECSIKKLQQLNYYVKVLSSTQPIPYEKENEWDTFGWKDFNVVILTECSYSLINAIDIYCRKRNIKLIVADIYGGYSRWINDFGNKFIVADKDGEEWKECMIKNIVSDPKDNNNSIITLLDGTRHEFIDDDELEISEVVGMDELNGKKYKIKVQTPSTFTLLNCDITKFKAYQHNGVCKQLKSQNIIDFSPISECWEINKKNIKEVKHWDQNMSISDYNKIENGYIINFVFALLDLWKQSQKYKAWVTSKNNVPWNKEIGDNIVLLAKENYPDVKWTEKELEIIYHISFTHFTQYPSWCAYLGGFVAQEAIKAITNKFTPINQVMFHDINEIMPKINPKALEESIKEFDFKEEKSNLDGIQMILGKKLWNKVCNSKIMVVGAGAIGC